MTPLKFSRLVAIHRLRGRSVEACQRVLVGGETAYAVAADMGISRSTVSRALAKLGRKVCVKCGSPIKG